MNTTSIRFQLIQPHEGWKPSLRWPVFAFVCVFGMCCATFATAQDNDSTGFFKTHPNDIDAQEQAGSVLFANRQVGLEFKRAKSGYQLTRLYGIADKQDFLVGVPNVLFGLRMHGMTLFRSKSVR